MIALYICAGALALLITLYLIFAVGKHKNMKKFLGVRYAHRGLHGEGAAENSMSAFRRAVEAGYGIELDVRLCADGELVVFHDDNLLRVCGIDKEVRNMSLDELSEARLLSTSDTPPRFSDVLALVDGRVPLLVEIKEDASDDKVSYATAEMLKNYTGPYIIESFNPKTVGRMRRLLPDVASGVLSMNYSREEKFRGKLLYWMLRHLLTNFICRPSFIAYCHTDFTPSLWVNRLFGIPQIAWTTHSQSEDSAALSRGFSTVIFENYTPEVNIKK